MDDLTFTGEALHVPAIGASREAKPENGKTFSLEEMQKYVGGYVEVKPLRGYDNMMIAMNEDGLMKKLPHNVLATFIAGFGLVGDILFYRSDQLE